MNSPIDELFKSISDALGIRLTPENFRSKFKDVESIRGITNKDKTFIIVEILDTLVKMNEQISSQLKK